MILVVAEETWKPVEDSVFVNRQTNKKLKMTVASARQVQQ